MTKLGVPAGESNSETDEEATGTEDFGDIGTLLHDVEDADDHDDGVADNISDGIEIVTPEDVDDDTNAKLNIGVSIDLPDADDFLLRDDEDGPLGDDVSGLAEELPPIGDEQEESLAEEDWLTEKLPELDDEGNGDEGVSDADLLANQVVSIPIEVPPLAASDNPWTEVELRGADAELLSLNLVAGHLVAAGRGLYEILRDGNEVHALQIALPSNTISSFTTVHASDRVFVLSTTVEENFRSATDGDQNRYLESETQNRAFVSAAPNGGLWLGGQERLWHMTDGQQPAAEPEMAPVAMAQPVGDYLLSTTEENTLVCWRWQGRWVLTGQLSAVDGSHAPSRLTTSGECVAVVREQRAYLSRDGGKTFVPLSGCPPVDTVGWVRIDDEECLVVSCHISVDSRSYLVLVKPDNSVTHLADLRVSDDAEDDDELEVLDLAWDDEHQRLWACGRFGLICLEPSHDSPASGAAPLGSASEPADPASKPLSSE